jgi:molybdopterin/thiamine biosynthesis adenylyltransferase
MSDLTQEEKVRYERQLILPQFGEKGQGRLKRARVLIAGIGGLGSISAAYLTAAGVGFLRIVDRDRVALSNLNRQLLHATPDLGRLKIESASEKLHALNPLVRIEAVAEDIRPENAAALAAGCDIILDATDNLATRRALNRAALQHKLPFIYGGVNGLDGMVAGFVPGKTACFDCLFGAADDTKGIVAVVGPIAGLVASIQTLEVIKIITGCGVPLKGELLRIQAGSMDFRKIRLDRNPECPACKAR